MLMLGTWRLFLLFPWLAVAADHAVGCPAAFANIPHLNSSNQTGWENNETTNLRLKAAIAHQNQIREQKNLHELSGAARSEVDRQGKVRFELGVRGAPTYEELGNFIAVEDTLIRGDYGDIYLLNYAYKFDGPKLVEVKPYAQWYLERVEGETVSLYRQMSKEEYALWKQNKFDQLGSTAFAPGKKVVHFSTDRHLTSAIQPANAPMIEIRVPKSTLLEIAQKGELQSGILSEDGLVSEFVFSLEQIQDLVGSGKALMRFPSSR